MNILFVDHICHQKTKSADFFLDILRKKKSSRCFVMNSAIAFACRRRKSLGRT